MVTQSFGENDSFTKPGMKCLLVIKKLKSFSQFKRLAQEEDVLVGGAGVNLMLQFGPLKSLLIFFLQILSGNFVPMKTIEGVPRERQFEGSTGTRRRCRNKELGERRCPLTAVKSAMTPFKVKVVWGITPSATQ